MTESVRLGSMLSVMKGFDAVPVITGVRIVAPFSKTIQPVSDADGTTETFPGVDTTGVGIGSIETVPPKSGI